MAQKMIFDDISNIVMIYKCSINFDENDKNLIKFSFPKKNTKNWIINILQINESKYTHKIFNKLKEGKYICDKISFIKPVFHRTISVPENYRVFSDSCLDFENHFNIKNTEIIFNNSKISVEKLFGMSKIYGLKMQMEYKFYSNINIYYSSIYKKEVISIRNFIKISKINIIQTFIDNYSEFINIPKLTQYEKKNNIVDNVMKLLSD